MGPRIQWTWWQHYLQTFTSGRAKMLPATSPVACRPLAPRGPRWIEGRGEKQPDQENTPGRNNGANTNRNPDVGGNPAAARYLETVLGFM